MPFDLQRARLPEERRAVARDKARSLFNRSSDVVNDATRDASNRWQGARASVRRLFTRGAMPDDDVLVDQWNAAAGRNDSVECEEVVQVHQLDAVFKDFRFGEN